MPRFYAELCVFIEAENLLYAEDIAKQAAERADMVSGVSSVSVNTVEDQNGDDDDPDPFSARRNEQEDALIEQLDADERR